MGVDFRIIWLPDITRAHYIMAYNRLIHSQLKAGITNWMESSHNILICFRPKHIFLERLHYELSPDIGLL